MKILAKQTGWTWRAVNPRISVIKGSPHGEYKIIGVYKEEKPLKDWQIDDWPPRKVKVLIILDE